VELLGWYNPPREVEQFAGSEGIHPWGFTAHVCELAVDIKTLTVCGGVPIWMGKVDHGPSLPSKSRLGGMEMGAGNGGAAPRLTNQSLLRNFIFPLGRQDGGNGEKSWRMSWPLTMTQVCRDEGICKSGHKAVAIRFYDNIFGWEDGASSMEHAATGANLNPTLHGRFGKFAQGKANSGEGKVAGQTDRQRSVHCPIHTSERCERCACRARTVGHSSTTY